MDNLIDNIEEFISPGYVIQSLIEEQELTHIYVANKMGISVEKLNKLIDAKARITTDMALKLEFVFNVPVSYWIKKEKSYRDFCKSKLFN